MNRSRVTAQAGLHRNLIVFLKIALFALVIAFDAKAFAVDPQPADAKDKPGMDYYAWPLPREMFSSVDTSSQDGKRKPLPGFKPKSNDSSRYDVSEFLKKAGIEFPPGSMAYYDEGAKILVVRNTPENLDAIDNLIAAPDYPTTLVNIDISTIECAPPPDGKPLVAHRMTYFDIEHLPAKSMELLDFVTLTTTSGQKVGGSHLSGPDSGKNTGLPNDKQETNFRGNPTDVVQFKPDETGSILEAEPVITPNGEQIELNISYKYKSPKTKAVGAQPFSLNFTTVIVAWDSYPVVIYVSPSENKGKIIAVVARVSLVNNGGWKWPLPQPPKALPPPASQPTPK